MLATRILSLYLILVGVAVAAHFVAVPWYHPGGGEPYPVWDVLDALMAVAIAIAFITALVHKRQHDAADGGSAVEHVSVNTVFYGIIIVGLLFYWNWSNLLRDSGESDWLVWNLIDVALPLLLVAAGRRLWRGSA